VLAIALEGLKLCQSLRGDHESEQQVRQIGSAQDPCGKDDLAGAEVNIPVLVNLTEPLDDVSG
jgi:hypothetical protein